MLPVLVFFVICGKIKRDMKKKEALHMTAIQRAHIIELGNNKKISLRIQKRLKLLLLAADGMSDYAIRKILGLDIEQIAVWRNRWEQGQAILLGLEEKGEFKTRSKDVASQIIAIMSDKDRSGKPAKITLAQMNQIIAIACEEPRTFGVPISKWTLMALREVIKEKQIVPDISTTYIGKILKKKITSTKGKKLDVSKNWMLDGLRD